MEKELNLVELLRDAPKGIKLYSPICGECELDYVRDNKIYILSDHGSEHFYINGNYLNDCGECLLFPSKENRDWSTFKIKKDDFQVGDYVKVKSSGKVYLIKQIKETGILVSNIINSSSDFEFPIDKSIISEKVTKFDPKWLKPFDRVLVKDTQNWEIALFSRIGKYSYVVEYVTISDSRVHLERLTFPAFKLNLPDEPYGCIYDNICGKHTWLIEGGDPKSIHPDEVYLRRLAQINNLKWEK